jgi:hypothetical protein
MLDLEGEYPRPLSEVTRRALALYREKLQNGLERSCKTSWSRRRPGAA